MSRSFKTIRRTCKKTYKPRDNYCCNCFLCTDSKTRYKKVGKDLLKVGLKEIETWFNPRGRLRVVRLNIDNIQPLEQRLKTCPKQVIIDLTEAKQKIKLKLNGALV